MKRGRNFTHSFAKLFLLGAADGESGNYPPRVSNKEQGSRVVQLLTGSQKNRGGRKFVKGCHHRKIRPRRRWKHFPPFDRIATNTRSFCLLLSLKRLREFSNKQFFIFIELGCGYFWLLFFFQKHQMKTRF